MPFPTDRRDHRLTRHQRQSRDPVGAAVLLRLGPRGLMLALAPGAAALFATAAWLWRSSSPPSLSKELSNG